MYRDRYPQLADDMVDLCRDAVTGPTVADSNRRHKYRDMLQPEALQLQAAIAQLGILLQPTSADRTLPVTAGEKDVAENPLAG